MPFSRPTLPTIIARVKNDIAGSFGTTAALFRRSFERFASNAIAAVSHQLHGHLDWIAAQIDPRTADPDIVESAHAAPWGIYRKEAVAWQGTATGTGTNATIIPAGTVFARSDDVTYTVDEDATITGGTVTLALTCEDAGADGSCDNGVELQVQSPVAGFDGTATVASTTTAGSNEESDAALLERALQRRQNPPKGGGHGDYEGWALEVPGITRAWEFPRQEGAGTVTLYVVNDDDDPITVDSSKIEEVEDYLDQPGRQPTTVDVFVYTPTPVPIDMTIDISPNTAEVQAAVEAELNAALARDATPGGMTVLLSKLNEAISVAPGEEDHDLSVPSANVSIPFGSLPVVGTITWGSL